MQLKQPLHKLLLPALTAAQKAYFDTIHLSPVHVCHCTHTHTHTHARTHTHTHTALSPTHVYCVLILCMYMPQTAFVHLLITHLCCLPPFTPVVPSPSFFSVLLTPPVVPSPSFFSVLLILPVVPSPSFSLCSSPLLWSPLPPFLCAPHPSCGPFLFRLSSVSV